METVKSLLQNTVLDRVDARILLHHLCQKYLGWSREMLIAHDQDSLPHELVLHWIQLESERKNGQPVAYLINHKEFHEIDLYVNEHVLIPRPETEMLVNAAIDTIVNRLQLKSYSKLKPFKVIDLGTGSGAIILSIANRFRSQGNEGLIDFTGSDISINALHVATRNSQHLELPFVKWIQSDWLTSLKNERFDLILSNPPYIASNDHHLLEGDLRFEPRLALTDDADGLSAYRDLLKGSIETIYPGGYVFVEHGYDQGADIRNLFNEQGYSSVETRVDLSGNERITMGQFLSSPRS